MKKSEYQNLVTLKMQCYTTSISLQQGLQTTARGPNAAREAISSGPQSHFVKDEKIIY